MSLILWLALALSPTVEQAKPGQPVATAPTGPISTANPASIAAYLQKEGYRSKLFADDGSPYIESAANGAKFYIYLQNCKEDKDCQDLMFRSSYDLNKDKPVTIDTINLFNADNRWARAYLNKDGEPVIEYDVLFTDQKVDEKMFGEAIAIWVDVLGTFHKAIDY
ncbi:MAG TPA: YbjN domain-containing protein [Sphingomicrobium sp.]|nr:YbjN domain-containing protein [Sphingomicrobium sp.]